MRFVRNFIVYLLIAGVLGGSVEAAPGTFFLPPTPLVEGTRSLFSEQAFAVAATLQWAPLVRWVRVHVLRQVALTKGVRYHTLETRASVRAEEVATIKMTLRMRANYRNALRLLRTHFQDPLWIQQFDQMQVIVQRGLPRLGYYDVVKDRIHIDKLALGHPILAALVILHELVEANVIKRAKGDVGTTDQHVGAQIIATADELQFFFNALSSLHKNRFLNYLNRRPGILSDDYVSLVRALTLQKAPFILQTMAPLISHYVESMRVVRPVANESVWPMYVVSDPLYLLLTAGTRGGVYYLYPNTYKQELRKRIINLAVDNKVVGAARLSRRIQDGGSILVASSFMQGKNEFLVATAIWEARMKLAFNQWREEGSKAAQVYFASPPELYFVPDHYWPHRRTHTSDPVRWLAGPVSSTDMRNRLTAVYGKTIASDMLRIRDITRPTAQEIAQLYQISVDMNVSYMKSEAWNLYNEYAQRIYQLRIELMIETLQKRFDEIRNETGPLERSMRQRLRALVEQLRHAETQHPTPELAHWMNEELNFFEIDDPYFKRFGQTPSDPPPTVNEGAAIFLGASTVLALASESWNNSIMQSALAWGMLVVTNAFLMRTLSWIFSPSTEKSRFRLSAA